MILDELAQPTMPGLKPNRLKIRNITIEDPEHHEGHGHEHGEWGGSTVAISQTGTHDILILGQTGNAPEHYDRLRAWRKRHGGTRPDGGNCGSIAPACVDPPAAPTGFRPKSY